MAIIDSDAGDDHALIHTDKETGVEPWWGTGKKAAINHGMRGAAAPSFYLDIRAMGESPVMIAQRPG